MLYWWIFWAFQLRFGGFCMELKYLYAGSTFIWSTFIHIWHIFPLKPSCYKIPVWYAKHFSFTLTENMCKNQCFSGKRSMPGMVNSPVNQHNRLRAGIWPLRVENLQLHTFTHAITIIHSSTNLSFAFISTVLSFHCRWNFSEPATHTHTHLLSLRIHKSTPLSFSPAQHVLSLEMKT